MDKTQRSIICDTCEKELIEDSEYPHRYGLELAVRDFGYNSSGFQFAVIQHPPLDRPYHFCGIMCLKEWAAKQ